MKISQGHVSVALAIAAPLAFYAGASALVVTYAPQVPADVIAKAHDRGYLLVILGILGFVISAALAGHNLRNSPKTSIIALSICGLSLLFPIGLVLFS